MSDFVEVASVLPFNNLANAYARQQQWNEAIRHYEVVLSLEPGMQAAAQNLATVRELQKASTPSNNN